MRESAVHETTMEIETRTDVEEVHMTLQDCPNRVSFNDATEIDPSSLDSPSLSSISASETTEEMCGKSFRSDNTEMSRDKMNVLKKRYSKLAFTVQGVRNGQKKRTITSRRSSRR
mmetsp:Transcript_13546/g.15792  ORF Transcript_13546/g.15792 Transcript_13546/m.15792 type:complete len:115 (+) Transcript_13546:97-441(+)